MSRIDSIYCFIKLSIRTVAYTSTSPVDQIIAAHYRVWDLCRNVTDIKTITVIVRACFHVLAVAVVNDITVGSNGFKKRHSVGQGV